MIGYVGGSVSISLPTIPRATAASISSVTLGSAATIILAPASASFLHTLRAKFSLRAETTIATQTPATNISWMPSLDEANAAPNATSVVGTLYCDTYSNGSLIGTAQVSVSAAIPGSVVPNGSVSFSEAEEGLLTQFGCFIQRKSKLSVSVTAEGAYGSSISSISTTVNGATYSGNSFTKNELSTAGTNTIRADDYGQSRAYDHDDADVRKWWHMTRLPAQSVSVYRCDASGNASNTGGFATVTVAGSISAVNNANTRALKIGYKRKSETTLYGYVVHHCGLLPSPARF